VNCTISNNIFFGRSIDTTGSYNVGTGCVFLNNITYLCSNSLPTPGNSGTGNIIGDPQFISFPLAPADFSYAYNFRINAASPATMPLPMERTSAHTAT
jgi:hypothetical protein